MKIYRSSPITGRVNVMDIDISASQYRDWEQGTLIQIAMPNISADEREFIISGSTRQDWETMSSFCREDHYA